MSLPALGPKATCMQLTQMIVRNSNRTLFKALAARGLLFEPLFHLARNQTSRRQGLFVARGFQRAATLLGKLLGDDSRL